MEIKNKNGSRKRYKQNKRKSKVDFKDIGEVLIGDDSRFYDIDNWYESEFR